MIACPWCKAKIRPASQHGHRVCVNKPRAPRDSSPAPFAKLLQGARFTQVRR